MTHSSGLPTNPPRIGVYDVIDNDVYTSQMFKQTLIAKPGETYHYSNIGYGYGWAIDNQHGMQRINHTGSNGYSYATFDYYPEIGG